MFTVKITVDCKSLKRGQIGPVSLVVCVVVIDGIWTKSSLFTPLGRSKSLRFGWLDTHFVSVVVVVNRLLGSAKHRQNSRCICKVSHTLSHLCKRPRPIEQFETKCDYVAVITFSLEAESFAKTKCPVFDRVESTMTVSKGHCVHYVRGGRGKLHAKLV